MESFVRNQGKKFPYFGDKIVKREEKQQLIAELHDVFNKAGLVVVTLNKGLTMPQTTELRNAVRADGANYRVTKNRLTKLALAGTPCESMADLMVGPTGLAYSEDALSAAKAVVKMAKSTDKFEVVGGVMNGQKVSVATIQELAALPSLDELRGKLVGLLVAPAGAIARVCKAYSEKEEQAA
jgi:large subunit ribosomal protein L10